MSDRREKIIVVDDIATNLSIAKSALSDKYDVFTAPSGAKLLLLLDRLIPDLILLDIEMPEMDGYDVITALKDSEKTTHIPVIFLTGKIDPEHEVKGLNLGAVDYITKPFSRELLLKRIDFHVLYERQRKDLLKINLNLESEVDKKTRAVMELQSTVLKTIAELVECRDNVTGDHIGRTQYALKLLIGLLLKNGKYVDDLSALDIPLLIMSSQLHDVGKISIRDSILLKAGKLDAGEWEEMKKHTTYGVDIIRRIERNTTESEFLHYAEIFAGSHHERWDGTGYPNGLKTEDIPLPGRLMSIVDVYDALINDRPYKVAYTHEAAIDIIKKGLGTQFDPVICDVFIENHLAFKDVKNNYETASMTFDDFHPAMTTRSSTVGNLNGSEKSHSDKMQRYLEILYDAMREHETLKIEVSSWDKDVFLFSARLHDIGDFSVTESLLSKADAKIAQKIKDSVESGDLQHHAEMLTGNHHEKWDGTGYPLGLKGKDIPLEGRLMAIVDVYDALTIDRPHRKRKTHKEAVMLIKNGSGTHFDPDLVELFLDFDKEFEKVSDS
jgi:putative two-component system response regulator